MQGKIPLNTIKAKIEFGYYTIPLFNSAIRVKIYINRGNVYNEY
jgi:ribosomal protein S3